MKNEVTPPRFFRTPADLRKWFMRHHATTPEILVGFYKKDSGRPSVTWPESVDEALCVGWIDGIRRTIDEFSYTIRFTPRRPTSVWSAVNIRRVQALTDEGRMRPAGLRAFAAWRENKSGIYSYEQRSASLVEPYAGVFRKNKAAWVYFESRSASFRKKFAWWVVSAKQETTRLRRLKQLIADCASVRPNFR